MEKKQLYSAILLMILLICQGAEAYLAHSEGYALDVRGFIAAGGIMKTSAIQIEGMAGCGNYHAMNSELYSIAPNLFTDNVKQPLELYIISPGSGIHTEDSIMMIEGGVNQSGATVTINSVTVPLIEGRFSYGYPLAFDENIIVIRAEAGNAVTEKIIVVYRDFGQITTAEDMLMSVARNFEKLYDLQATLVSQDMYNGNALIGMIWSKLYFKSPGEIRLESYYDASMIEEYSTFVLNDTMLYNKSEDGTIHETDLCLFADLERDEYDHVNIPFDIASFILGHELTLETYNNKDKSGWLSAVPRTFSDLYSEVRLNINCDEGVIRVMELFSNDMLVERNEVVDVVMIDGIVIPKTIRKTTFLPLGNYISDYVLENIAVNQGLGDGLFFLN
ncbi:MAG: hypothetical protein JW938_01270 [Candidatus Omnitrophica bacterium]|nr:hypothetical protein [Candidatus Omnitrophota bacterium]